MTISCATDAADVRFTTNGVDVATDSDLYTNAFILPASTTVKAKAFKAGMSDSLQAVSAFDLQPPRVDTPVIAPAAGTYYGGIEVTISCTTDTADVRFTTNGVDVAKDSDLYTGVFILTAPATVKTKAFKAGMSDSLQAESAFDVKPARVDTPVIAPAAGFYANSVDVTISCTTDVAEIRFTTNGVDVNAASDLYMGSFTLTETTTVKAKVFKAGMSDSLQAESVFTVIAITDLEKDVPQTGLTVPEGDKDYFRFAVPTNVATLRFVLTGGTGDGDLIVRFGSLAETNDYDYYPALEGNEETVTVDNPADGFWYATLLGGTGGVAGVQLTASFDLVPPTVATPVIAPSGGVKVGPILVSITCVTTSATIRYTLDGTDPSSNSTLYAAPFKLGPTSRKMVKARAFNTGMTDSAIASATYIIARKIKPGQTILISGVKGSSLYFAIQPPAGALQLSLSLTGGTGNGNLYVRKSLLPSVTVYNYRSNAADNNELIQIPNPRSGKWYFILLKMKSNVGGASLHATIP